MESPPAVLTSPAEPPAAVPPPSFPDGIHDDVLRDLTGQTAVRTVAQAQAQAMFDLAKRTHAAARSATRNARVALNLRRLRLAEARWGIAPAVDAVLVSSVPTLVTAVFLIFVFHPGLAVLGVILAATYGAGITLALGLFLDRAGEEDSNRLRFRQADCQRHEAIVGDRLQALVETRAELKRTRGLYDDYRHIKKIAGEKDGGIVLLVTEADMRVFIRQAKNGKTKETYIQEIYDRTVRAISQPKRGEPHTSCPGGVGGTTFVGSLTEVGVAGVSRRFFHGKRRFVGRPRLDHL